VSESVETSRASSARVAAKSSRCRRMRASTTPAKSMVTKNTAATTGSASPRTPTGCARYTAPRYPPAITALSSATATKSM
jgi:hypothetical protein